MPPAPRYILLTLGEELLLGLTPNGHLSYIGDQLRQGGAVLRSNLTLSDAPEDIEESFRYYWERADALITTGGLGPTVDDRSKEVIADCLGEELVFDPSIMEAIEARFAQMGRVATPNNRKQAYRFANGEVLPNPNGTAPGLWLEKEGKILIMLPGPPHELYPMFEQQVLPRLRHRGLLSSQENYLQIRTTGVGESSLEAMLEPLLKDEKGLELAFCAHPGLVDLRLSLPGVSETRPRLEALAGRCRERLGEGFVCFGNASLAQIVSDLLRQVGKTLATAESCTGGWIANELTNLPGSSDIFLGGLVSYSEAAKVNLLDVPISMIQEHSAVSEAVAEAMAAGVAERFQADYALSATGYLGPSGGTEADPVGTVYVGLRAPRGTRAARFNFAGTRQTVKERVHHAALDLLRRELLEGA